MLRWGLYYVCWCPAPRAAAGIFATLSKLACILLDDEVTFAEYKISTLVMVADVNAESFWRGLFAKALANVNIGAPSAVQGLVGWPRQLLLHLVSQTLLPQLRRKWKQRKKNLRSPMMTWALVFLFKPHFVTCSIKTKH